jgi:hypothetical protein
MKNDTKFWIGMAIFFVVLLLLLLLGCKPKKPSRLATCIVCGTNGVDTGWYAFQMETGDVIEQEGVEMGFVGLKSVYPKNNGLGGIEYVLVADGIQEATSSGITGPGGQMIVKGKRYNWSDYKYRVLYGGGYIPSGSWGMGARFDYRTSTPPQRQVALAELGCGNLEKYTAIASKFTSTEQSALDNPTTDAPESGVAATASLLQQQGGCGEGFPKEMNNGFMAGNLADAGKYLRHSSPFMFSFVLKTSEPEELAGVSIPVRISTDTHPQGVSADATIIASNADKMTHVARTDYFLPVNSEIPVQPEMPVYERWTGFTEPNIWDTEQYYIEQKENWLDFVDPNLYADPNVCPDPNVLFNPNDLNFFDFTSRLDTSAENFEDILIPERILSIKAIQINAANDFVYIEIDWANPRMIILIAEHWLTAKKLYDFNNDGIVNLCDWPN